MTGRGAAAAMARHRMLSPTLTGARASERPPGLLACPADGGRFCGLRLREKETAEAEGGPVEEIAAVDGVIV